jgi:metallophosphoesterase superfamily enzyme
MINTRRRLTPEEWQLVQDLRSQEQEVENILVIGDLHLPFILEGYLEHCIDTYHKYNCNKVIFIGDIIDNHYSSFHDTDPDGYGAGEELDRALDMLQDWYKAFPEATVILGNHDRIVHRKAFAGGVSKRWIRDYKEVLNTPSWNYVEEYTSNGVTYVHGEGGTARSRIKTDMHSIVQGHLHTQCYIDWIVNDSIKIFGMQVGAGIDRKSYAMAYAKAGKKPAVACGVVLDNGKTPINITMDL